MHKWPVISLKSLKHLYIQTHTQLLFSFSRLYKYSIVIVENTDKQNDVIHPQVYLQQQRGSIATWSGV